MSIPPPWCPVCGQSCSPPGGRDRPGCPNRWCRRGDRFFSVVFAAARHDAALRRAIVRYKYRGERELAGVFASMLARYLLGHSTWFEEFDVVTAVPSYSGPGARRRWDPVGALLEATALRLGGVWAVDPSLLEKTRETEAMAGLGWSDRRRVAATQLRPALRVPDPGRVAGSQVLLVDDVFTDGCTMREAAWALRAAGASDVAGLVVARPLWSRRPSVRRTDAR